MIYYSPVQSRGWVPTVIIAQFGSIEAEDYYAGPMSRIDAGDLLRVKFAEKRYLNESELGNFVLRKNLNTELYRYILSCNKKFHF